MNVSQGEENYSYLAKIAPHIPLSTSDHLVNYFRGSPTSYKLARFAAEKFKDLFFLGCFELDEDINLTSCLHTTLALNRIFLKKEESEFAENLTFVEFNFKAKLDKVYKIYDLIIGKTVSEMDISTTLNSPDYIVNIIKKGNELIPELEKTLNIYRNNTTKFLKTDYDFNLETFNKFKMDLLSDEPLETYSKFFNVFIRAYESEFPNSYFHVFSIEKFKNAKGDLFFRSYESFIENYTLIDYFLAKNYQDGEFDQGCLNSASMEEYLANLEKIVCESKAPPNEGFIDPQIVTRCFGAPGLLKDFSCPEFLEIDETKNTISGVTFLYLPWTISHHQTLDNLAAMIDEDHDLSNEFEKLLSQEPSQKKHRTY